MDPEKRRAITIRLSVLALILITIISVSTGRESVIKIYSIIGAYLLLLSIIGMYLYLKDDVYNLKTAKLCLIWNISIVVILSILFFVLFIIAGGGVNHRY
jgi:hypothetical protein